MSFRATLVSAWVTTADLKVKKHSVILQIFSARAAKLLISQVTAGRSKLKRFTQCTSTLQQSSNSQIQPPTLIGNISQLWRCHPKMSQAGGGWFPQCHIRRAGNGTSDETHSSFYAKSCKYFPWTMYGSCPALGWAIPNMQGHNHSLHQAFKGKFCAQSSLHLSVH